jgi:hypothetical protein
MEAAIEDVVVGLKTTTDIEFKPWTNYYSYCGDI